MAYITPTAVYTVGVAITANGPTSTGGTITAYSVSPALPRGLSLSTTTGVISGTPTAVTAATSYTVTASNSAGSTTATLTITVQEPAPAGLSYGVTTAFYTAGVAITANSPSSTGGTITAYSVSPTLPSGLSLDTGTGIISGTPTAVTTTALYTVTATNGSGSTRAPLAITVTNAPVAPVITVPPTLQSVTVGDAVIFTVTAAGTAPLSYQWYLNHSAISGATADYYTISSASLADAGSYTVTVSNSAGTVTSTAAALAVNSAVVAPTITTYPANLEVTVNSPATFSVTATGSKPLSYQWYQGTTKVGTDSSYAIGSAQSSDAGSYKVTVSNSAGSVTSNAVTLTVDATPVAPSITTQPLSQSVTEGNPASFTVTSTGTAPLTYQWQKDGSDVGGSTDFYTLSSAATGDAGSYTVKVSNSAGSATSTAVTLAVSAKAVAPTISTQPASLTVTEGQPATFTVAATGSTTLHYQWQDNGVDVGTDSETYTLALPRNSNSGDGITVTVSNTAGSVTSSAATLTVNPLVVTLAPSTPLNLTPIAAGTFTMGKSGIATPVHQVTISQNFYMGTYLVTQAQWLAVMGSNPSYFNGQAGHGDGTVNLQRPVEKVSYTAITTASIGFLALLNAEITTICPNCPTGYVFRLPTEAEWEYACRAGTTSSWYWGDSDIDSNGHDFIGNYAWYTSNSSSTTHPVGMLLPNTWGLYDMAGNLWEWCQDYYSDSYDPTAAQTDPAGSTIGSSRAARGGCWYDISYYCCSAYRADFDPGICDNCVGFRVVLAPPRTP